MTYYPHVVNEAVKVWKCEQTVQNLAPVSYLFPCGPHFSCVCYVPGLPLCVHVCVSLLSCCSPVPCLPAHLHVICSSHLLAPHSLGYNQLVIFPAYQPWLLCHSGPDLCSSLSIFYLTDYSSFKSVKLGPLHECGPWVLIKCSPKCICQFKLALDKCNVEKSGLCGHLLTG